MSAAIRAAQNYHAKTKVGSGARESAFKFALFVVENYKSEFCPKLNWLKPCIFAQTVTEL